MNTHTIRCFAASAFVLASLSAGVASASFYPPSYVIETACQRSGPVEVCALNQRSGMPQLVVRYQGSLLATQWGRISAYVKLNERFHSLLGELAGSAFMARELERVASLPFASPSGFVVVQANSPQARDMLIVAQDQHWQVLDAIERREGARAEALMREHSRIAQRNLRDAVKSHDLDQMPGVRLIRKRS